MRTVTDSLLIFVIDTDEYAGNFERQMTAYITGCVGACGVGEDIAEDALKELGHTSSDWADGIIIQVPDDHGCWRPCSIFPTPGWVNDGKGGHFRKGEKDLETEYPCYNSVGIYLGEQLDENLLTLLMDRAKKYNSYIAEKAKGDDFIYRFRSGNISGFRLIEEKTTHEELESWSV